MVTVNEKLTTEPGIPYDLFAPRERIVFVDIETTGLKAGAAMLYLIGAAGFENGSWNLHQFLAESKAEEMSLLSAFSEYLNSKRSGQDHLILVSYNGDRFDLPFLKEVERQYGRSGMFRDTVSFDLYKTVKPFKKLLKLENLKLKTLERFCGICREDIYSGGELIYVYEEYLRLRHMIKGGCEDNELNQGLMEKCLSCLLLHNAEDISDMLPVMQMLSYRFLFDGIFETESAEVFHVGSDEILDLRFRMPCALPAELYLENGNVVISASGKDRTLLEITNRIVEDELRLYFDDYKEYYYLPAEDMAVHRSIGEFVDRKNRRKATADTCYIREAGKFLEVPEEYRADPNVFRRTRKGKAYIRYREELLSGKEELKALGHEILREFLAFPINESYN